MVARNAGQIGNIRAVVVRRSQKQAGDNRRECDVFLLGAWRTER